MDTPTSSSGEPMPHTAIFQNADEPQILSTAEMLRIESFRSFCGENFA